MIGDGYVLLVDIFTSQNFLKVVNEKFLIKIMDDFEFIQDEEIFNALVNLIASISYEYKDPKEDLTLKICLTHKN